MFLTYLGYVLCVVGVALALNASAFKARPASRAISYALALAVFLTSFVVLISVSGAQHRSLLLGLGIPTSGRSTTFIGTTSAGAIIAAWLFFSVLRKLPRQRAVGAAADHASAQGLEAGRPALNSSRLRKLSIAGAVLLVAVAAIAALWPNAPQSFEDCVLEKMKGQAPSLLPVARKACSAGSGGAQVAPNVDQQPSFDAAGWTQESTGSREIGPWLNYDPKGTRYCRYFDRTIQRLYPPGLRPNAEPANPFCLGTSELQPPE